MHSDRVVTFFRALAFPFSLIYGAVIWVRNLLFDIRIIPSSTFNLPLICVGNLSVGGTGKSPMVEYLVRDLKDRFRVATVSRGYKRKTRGYVLAGKNTTAIDIGDEPMQFYLKFPDIMVAVGEERLVAIPQLLHDHPDTEVIILDDAFQHRAVRSGLNILLTDCQRLFTRDSLLPAGRLRDLKSSYKRANIVVVTKCKKELDEREAGDITREINPLPHQHIFFTTIRYGIPYHVLNRTIYRLDKETSVLLVEGIANPGPMKELVTSTTGYCEIMNYRNHHIFSIDDWRNINRRFQSMEGAKKIILTTEKDAVRLLKFQKEMTGIPLFVLPVEHEFLFGKAAIFNEIVNNFIRDFPGK